MAASIISPELSLDLQILTLLVAVIGPILAYYSAKRLALSANRQNWLDALRNDIAELISVSDNLHVLNSKKSNSGNTFAQDDPNEFRKELVKLQSVRYKIRLRLRIENKQHSYLYDRLMDFLRNQDVDQRGKLREELVLASEALIQKVWKQIEAGK